MKVPDHPPDEIFHHQELRELGPSRFTGLKAVPSNDYGGLFSQPMDYVAQYSPSVDLVDYIIEIWYVQDGPIRRKLARKTLASDWRRRHGDQTIHPLSN